MRTLPILLSGLALSFSSSAATFGPYPTQTYHVCAPTKPTHVAAVLAHGNWATGSGTEADALLVCQGLAAAGIYTVSINYRMFYTARWPAPLQDMQLAIRWLRSQGFSRVGAVGKSAGGNMALMAGAVGGVNVSNEVDSLHESSLLPGVSSRPDFVVSISGPPDICLEAAEGTPDGNIPYVPLPYNMACAAMSPVVFIDAQMPPTIIFEGLTDPFITVAAADELQKILKVKGVTFQSQPYNGGHVFNYLPASSQTACVAEAARFALTLKVGPADVVCAGP